MGNSKTDTEKIADLTNLRREAIREAQGMRYARTHSNLLSRKDKKHGVENKGNLDWDKIAFDEPLRIAVVNDSFRDVQIMNAALLMGEIEFPCETPVIVVELSEVQTYTKGREETDWRTGTVTYKDHRPHGAAFVLALISYGEIVFDIRDESFPFKLFEGKNSWEYWWEYDGLRPYKPHVMDVRDMFISTISNYWYGSFISGYESTRSSSGANLSLERAANLATALSLGQIEFDIATLRKVKAPAWQRDAIRNVRFSDNSLPEGIESLDEEIDKAQALLAFWEKAADYYRFSMRIDREDLDDVEKLTQLCHRCGEMIGVDIYLDTYAAGVPAEDILV